MPENNSKTLFRNFHIQWFKTIMVTGNCEVTQESKCWRQLFWELRSERKALVRFAEGPELKVIYIYN